MVTLNVLWEQTSSALSNQPIYPIHNRKPWANHSMITLPCYRKIEIKIKIPTMFDGACLIKAEKKQFCTKMFFCSVFPEEISLLYSDYIFFRPLCFFVLKKCPSKLVHFLCHCTCNSRCSLALNAFLMKCVETTIGN